MSQIFKRQPYPDLKGDTTMKRRDREYFRSLLANRLEELLKQADDTVADLIRSTDRAIDLVDQASLDTERSFRLRIRDRESRLISKIRQALARIEDGTFGICEVCGEDIALARLKARPVTTFCIGCKNQMETLERLTGRQVA